MSLPRPLHRALTVSKFCKICKRCVVANGVKMQNFITKTPGSNHYCSHTCYLKDPTVWKE